MKNTDKLRRWEMALALSLCITLFHGFAFGGVNVGWWGVIFPGLTPGESPETVETARLYGGGEERVEVRFWLLDFLSELFQGG